MNATATNLIPELERPSCRPYQLYAEFDADYGFAEKAGFQLSPLQILDTNKFVTWSISACFFEVGGGKTACSTVVSLMRGVSLTLVIVPPILIDSWFRWLKKVSEGVVIFRGTPRVRHALDLTEARWIICSHAIFRDDYERLSLEYKSRPSAELIVDEAHALKNIESVLFKKVMQLTKDGNLQMLTGTPISKPLDTYAFIALKNPGAYRSFAQFENLFVQERDFFGKAVSYQNLEIMAKDFASKTVTRTKYELHGYKNDPIYPDTEYSLSAGHYRLYEKLVNEQLLLLDNGDKIDASTSTRLYHALQQIVCNYNYFSGDETKRSAAYDIIDQTLEETECFIKGKSKLIIWTHYKLTSRTVTAYLNSKCIKTVAAFSETNSNKSFESFMEDETTRILVAQPSSAGAGLNPQSVCSEALFLEMSTTPLLTRQAIGRLDRVGQLSVPRMKIAVATGTIQTQLLAQLFRNDDLVGKLEVSKKSLREILLGR